MSKIGTANKATEDCRDHHGMTPADWVRLDAMTDEEIEAAALADPDCPPLTPEQLSRMHRISPARFTRLQLAMSLEQFSAVYGIPKDVLIAWERHDAEPSSAELSYLRAILSAPEAVRKALAMTAA
jgi:putative transcriptional regulator